MQVSVGERWATSNRGPLTIHVIGDPPSFEPLIDRLDQGARVDDCIASVMARSHGHFAAIIEGPDVMVALVDQIRSYPLFVDRNGSRIIDSPPADPSISSVDRASVLELAMTGYVTGRSTLDSEFQQLRAGDALIVDEDGHRFLRYFAYRPNPAPAGITLDEVASVHDRVFDDVVERAAGRPIWVPLSGGWDSRFVLAALKTRNYDPLVAFSYGSPRGFEATMARSIADALKVKWLMVPRREDPKELFRSPARREYWRYAHRLVSVPVMTEFRAFSELVSSGTIPTEAVVVNGQSGDFTSGGHIPQSLSNPEATKNEFFDRLLGKHYSLWMELKTEDNIRLAQERIDLELQDIFEDPPSSGTDLAWAYEAWEFQERQSKYVVNQQRLYEFYGLDWMLPLWDGRLVDLWSRATLQQKLHQKRFGEFLMKWDPQGVFSRFPRATWDWPKSMAWVKPVARTAGLLGGTRAKDAVYTRFMYRGAYHDEFQMYGPLTYQRHVGNLRNPASLHGRALLSELGIAWPRPATDG